MFTRRQRILLDLLTRCHAVEFHPSPVHLARLLRREVDWPRGTSKQAVRSELVRLLEAGAVVDVERGAGVSPAKYALADCDCERCRGHRR